MSTYELPNSMTANPTKTSGWADGSPDNKK
jgi:hypothetical protein